MFAHLTCSRILAVVNKSNIRQWLNLLLGLSMVVCTALMVWKGTVVASGSEAPIVVVLSGSMEPAFRRGDLLFLTKNHPVTVRVGDIVVYKVEGRDVPIVHRVIAVHEKGNGSHSVKFLTKGDNNNIDDKGLYAPGQLWLTGDSVVGKARVLLPHVGIVTIYMNDYPVLKYALLICAGVYMAVFGG